MRGLTLTLVVFEFSFLGVAPRTLQSLTLTLVVFESAFRMRQHIGLQSLTLTLVVFESSGKDENTGLRQDCLTLTLVVFESRGAKRSPSKSAPFNLNIGCI